MATESPLRSILYGMLQGVAVLVDSCCSSVPSSELLLILCFSSMGEHCYVFHMNLNFTNNSTPSSGSKREVGGFFVLFYLFACFLLFLQFENTNLEIKKIISFSSVFYVFR